MTSALSPASHNRVEPRGALYVWFSWHCFDQDESISPALRQYKVRFHVGYYRFYIYMSVSVCLCVCLCGRANGLETYNQYGWVEFLICQGQDFADSDIFWRSIPGWGLGTRFCPASRVQYYNNLQYIGDVGKCVPRFTEHSVSVRTVKWHDFPMLHIWIQLYRWKLRACPNSSILEQLWLITSVLTINNQQQLGMLHTPFRNSFNGRGFWRLVRVVNNFRRFD